MCKSSSASHGPFGTGFPAAQPGGIVASTFASHADDRGLISSGDRFGRMEAGHQTMVLMVVVLIRAAKITRVRVSGVASRLCCRENCTERTAAAPQKKRRSAPRSPLLLFNIIPYSEKTTTIVDHSPYPYFCSSVQGFTFSRRVAQMLAVAFI